MGVPAYTRFCPGGMTTHHGSHWDDSFIEDRISAYLRLHDLHTTRLWLWDPPGTPMRDTDTAARDTATLS